MPKKSKETKKQDVSRSRRLELKGDLFYQKKNLKKAIGEYQKALDLDEKRLELYDKIIKVHGENTRDWTENDFAYTVSLTMQKQEILNPTFKRIHARAEPEFKEIHKLIKQMWQADAQESETASVEQIVRHGEKAVYPLADFILNFKELQKTLKDKLKKKP